jgi:hypothetical protein
MRKAEISDTATPPPTSDDIAKWIPESPSLTPAETAAEDMRAITARFADALVDAFSKVPKNA